MNKEVIRGRRGHTIRLVEVRIAVLEAERDAAIEMAQMRGRAAGEAEREVVRLREALEGLCQCHDLQPGCRPCYACEALEWKWDAADEK